MAISLDTLGLGKIVLVDGVMGAQLTDVYATNCNLCDIVIIIGFNLGKRV
jgi:hypothetical protein